MPEEGPFCVVVVCLGDPGTTKLRLKGVSEGIKGMVCEV